MRHTTLVSSARLVRLFVCFSLLAQSLIPVTANASRVSAAGNAVRPPATSAAPRQMEANDLPDIDEVRNRPHHEPQAVPAVPSTRRRCPPRNPRCNDGVDDEARPTPTPTPARQPGRERAAVEESSWGSLAAVGGRSILALASAALNGGRPMMDVELLDFYRGGGHSVSDAGPAPLLAAASPLAAAPPLPEPVQAGETPQSFVTSMSLGGLRGDSPGWTGFKVTTGSQAITLTALGRMCAPGNSLLHELRLIRASDNALLASTSVSMSGCTAGQFRYADLPGAVTLAAGAAYLVVSYEAGGDRFHDWTGTLLTTTPAATVNHGVYTTNGGQTWGPAGGVGNSYVPLDFKYTPGGPTTAFVTGRTLGTMRSDSPGWTGFKMTTGPQPVSVTSLGRMCLPGNSLSHDLKLVRVSDNAAVATATVAMGGCTSGQFKYAPLASPVTLAANTSYLLVSYEVGADRFHDWTGTALTTTAVATVNHGVYTTNGGQTWGPAGSTGNSYVPLDFKYQTDEQGPGSGIGTGLTAKYYDNIDFTSHAMTRTDASVNFDWAGGAPTATMGVDDFTVRWTGLVVPRYSETYTFYTTTDDGVRLWIDGQLVTDRWIDQAPTEWASSPLALEAGRAYAIRMEFYERGGGALAWLKWSSTSQPKEFIPQSRLYGCWKAIDQFVKDFYQGALTRQPSTSELNYWAGRVTQAQGDSQLLSESQALGASLFQSAEYAARNRSDNDYVSDLYRAYLQRQPDAGGLNWWASQITPCGSDQQCRATKRGDVLAAFAFSGEFGEKVRSLCGIAPGTPGGGGGYNFSAARLEPSNRTGDQGVDPLSRNFNFSLPLVSLAGRAGHDLGLTLSYNSLVWTKDVGGVTFDADRGFPSPGFRLGFPTIQPKFYNPQTGKHAYLLLTPSGGRVELRQTNTQGVYESADSTYMQLTEGGVLSLRSTDGTLLSFSQMNGEYRCTQVKDRNGNFISASYHGDGRLNQVVDTLGRAVTFNYDANLNLISVTQPWKRETETGVSDGTHTWASFGYANLTLQPQFSNLAVVGEQPGTVVPVVTQVGVADGSYYKFSYNVWGQVWKVTHYAADSVNAQGQPDDSHPLSHTRLNLPGSDSAAASPQTDCPRFTEETVWVEYGVMGKSGEVTTSFSPWAPDMASCDITPPDLTPGVSTPDDVVFRNTYATSGWQKGLITRSEVFAGGQSKKVRTFGWEHDGGAAAAFPTNARVNDTTVSDPGVQTRRTHINYTAAFGLAREVIEYKPDAATALRRTETDYRIDPANDSAYLDRRIIGLVRERRVYGLDPAANVERLYSKIDYQYDWQTVGGLNYLQQQGSPVQHDNTGFGAGFVVGRGNQTSERRWDVTAPANSALAVESTTGYNTDGSVIFTRDALGHQLTVNYADKFWSQNNLAGEISRNTFAYPTTVTDAEGFASTSEYLFDLGLARQIQTPLPNVNTSQPGPVGRRYYDGAGRVVKDMTVNNGAYTRTVYPAKMDMVQTYRLVETGVEDYSASVFDGAGRVRATLRLLPGSIGGYAGQLMEYDAAGRMARQSNPTETNAAGTSWAATGEDAAASWLYTRQDYDWSGRPTTTTNVDGTTRVVTYGGCGCAGGGVMTVRDENGRQRRTTSDIFGRAVVEEDFNWDGTVYRTMTRAFDTRDQLTSTRVYQGAAATDGSCPSNSCQETSMTYDGHGRLATRKLPAQSSPTVYAYNADDTTREMTDARGARETYAYTPRHLVGGVTYSEPAGMTAAPDATFAYDAAGNRTLMTDGSGQASYAYDIHSQLQSETRQFTNVGSYQLTYQYALSGELKKITDWAGVSVSYGYDQSGSLNAVTGAGGGAASYATNMKYRASGALHGLTYGNGHTLSFAYNNRLQTLRHEVKNAGGATLLGQEYDYTSQATNNMHNDGRVKYARDLVDTRVSRFYKYDQVGRVSQGLTGAEAQYMRNTGQEAWGSINGPYWQVYGYNTWDDLDFRVWRTWEPDQYQPGKYNPWREYYGATFVNGRNTAWQYDNEGRPTLTNSLGATFTYGYDSAGLMTLATKPNVTTTRSYDGDGQKVREVENTTTTYYVRSSAIGGEVVGELNAAGAVTRRYVYADDEEPLATVEGSQVKWYYRDPINSRLANAVAGSSQLTAKVEFDPAGVKVDDDWALYASNVAGPNFNYSAVYERVFGRPRDPSMACYIDGFERPCSMVFGMLNNGFAIQCPDNVCSRYNWEKRRFESYGTEGWRALNPSAQKPTLKRSPQTRRPRDRRPNRPRNRNPNNVGDDERNPRHPVLYTFFSSCYLNFVLPYSQGQGHSFRVLDGPYGPFVDHDGDHIRSGLDIPGIVGVLPAIDGMKVEKTGGQGDGLFYMDVRLPTGDVAVFKDLTSVSYRKGERLVGGSVLGYVRPGTASNVTNVGLHLTIITKTFYDRKVDNYRSLTPRIAAEKEKLNAIVSPLQEKYLKPELFIRLDSDLSPFKCH